MVYIYCVIMIATSLRIYTGHSIVCMIWVSRYNVLLNHSAVLLVNAPAYSGRRVVDWPTDRLIVVTLSDLAVN